MLKMRKSSFCQLWLTCANQKEADAIKNTLLVKHFVACVREISVKSTFHWQGKIEQGDEIMLLMESRMDLFNKVEAEIKKLHSYETFVLEAVAVDRISKEAEQWMEEEVKDE